MLTPREAFRVGFLMGCADRGLTGEQVKAAALRAKNAFDLNSLKPVGDAAWAAAVGLPIAAGAGLGYLAHRAASPDVDDDDIKKQELIEEMRHYARVARDRQRVRALRASLGVGR